MLPPVLGAVHPTRHTPWVAIVFTTIVGTVWLRENFRDEVDEDEMRGDDD